jgi:hypothetical protein
VSHTPLTPNIRLVIMEDAQVDRVGVVEGAAADGEPEEMPRSKEYMRWARKAERRAQAHT